MIEFVSPEQYTQAVETYSKNSRLSLPLLQSPWWGHFKSHFGWTPLYCLVDARPLLILARKLPVGGDIWYIPWGPAWLGAETTSSSDVSKTMIELQVESSPRYFNDLQLLSDELLRAAEACNAISNPVSLRFDIPVGVIGYVPDSSVHFAADTPSSLRLPAERVQVPTTVILPLHRSFDALLADMKKKTRYNIKLAQKKGVTVRKAGSDELEKWYAMYRETAQRDAIAIHSLEYYQTFLQNSEQSDDGPAVMLLLAEHEGDLLAGIIIAMYDGVATYMYGASYSLKRNLMPAYLLQAEAIQIAQIHGCHSYDMLGIPATADPSHPMHGLFRFKTGFGGTIVRRAGIVDRPAAVLKYSCVRLAGSVRRWYFNGVRKRLIRRQ